MFKKCILGLLLVLVVGSPMMCLLGFTTHGVIESSVDAPDPEPVTTEGSKTPIAETPTAIATEEATATSEAAQQENWGVIPTSTPCPIQ